ncbi:MAG: multicopper oxidase domain-containing protein [Gemmatimonadota bacterium]
MTSSDSSWTRRSFLTHSISAGVGIGVGATLLGGRMRVGGRRGAASEAGGPPLLLRVAPDSWDLGRGVEAPMFLVNRVLPSPLIRLTRGRTFSTRMENGLPDPLILHWHGLAVPDDVDGHPRLAVPPGGHYDYSFQVNDRGGTYWYHSHAHHLTGRHTYRGIAGLLIVDDPQEERGVELPPRERELPLILQDRRLGADGVSVYDPTGPSMMNGFMGPEALVNGQLDAIQEVEPAVYRARILNGSNARIFRLARSDGRPMVLVANDGGFLERPVTLPHLDVAPAERVELLMDFRDLQDGERVVLRSLEFQIPGGMMGGMGGMGGRGGMGRQGMMGGMGSRMAEAYQQGRPLDLLTFHVKGQTSHPGVLPTALPPMPELPDPARSVRERRFDFNSRMMNHTVNGRAFEMDRVDEEVPFGQTEIWTFVNTANYPHPVHLHATHFRVLGRRGGRGEIYPWEAGRKDTVLVLPGEEVDVAVRFTEHRGLYLLHCHNMEHEDHGMMQNILVV